jgi:hypothetical protein
MSCKCNWSTIHGTSVGGAISTVETDIANTVKSFLYLCSWDKYDPSFRVIKDSAQTLPIDLTP